ncbi:hypothetical protein AMATHDRAFT_45887 [Amanita thiersii Skay4041]|uniref:3-carboxymuconate cyclase n=1 Tax=Amanita thiersii Skay4041 TaxID=703135 RepID=A0A2A9NUE0_9AGAR|nr:hypothetical protein AMATHDRAFT_45887 [Amanita thiersii Skay4041]
MRTSFFTAVFLSTLLSPVFSASVTARNKVGAVYVISNTPDGEGNQLLVSDIYDDGQVAFRDAIRAGGLGGHGEEGPQPGGDPLFSQGAVVVSQEGNVAVTVNAGSNTLSIFTINPQDPGDVKLLAKPIASGGQFPLSVALNKAGTKACTLNGGALNGVACFNVDKTYGLVPIQQTIRNLHMKQTTPPTGPPGSASQIVFSEDEKHIFALVKGSPTEMGFVAIWDFAADGSLSKRARILNLAKGVLPFSLTQIPGTFAFVSGDASVGYDVIDIEALDNIKKTALTPYKVEGQIGICWSVRSPSTGNYYLTDTAAGNIVEVSIGQNLRGNMITKHDTERYDNLLDLDVGTIGGKDYLYALASNYTTIDVVEIPMAGQGRMIQRLDLSCGAAKLGLPVEKMYVSGMAVYMKK